MTSPKFVVDIGRPESWPDAVHEIVDTAVRRAPEPIWREHPFDYLGWGDFDADERDLRAKLQSHRVVGYHAARLLPHEIHDVRNVSGLQVLTENLRRRKVTAAVTRYPSAFVDDPDGSVLLKAGPNDWQGTADGRLGWIDFVAPYIVFDHDAWGLMNLLDTWGGETLGWLADESTAERASAVLTASSQPVIVEIAVNVATLNTYTPLLPAFAGSLENIGGRYWHQWRTNESVPPQFVLDVITTDSLRWPQALAQYRL